MSCDVYLLYIYILVSFNVVLHGLKFLNKIICRFGWVTMFFHDLPIFGGLTFNMLIPVVRPGRPWTSIGGLTAH